MAGTPSCTVSAVQAGRLRAPQPRAPEKTRGHKRKTGQFAKKVRFIHTTHTYYRRYQYITSTLTITAVEPGVIDMYLGFAKQAHIRTGQQSAHNDNTTTAVAAEPY